MKTSKLINQLKSDEGLKLKPYHCTAGKLTIGIGRNLDDVGITEDEAMLLLKNDLRRVAKALQERLPFFNDLNPARKRAMVNMGFQLGVPGLIRFKNMLAAIERQDWDGAYKAALNSKWAKQDTPERALRVAERLKTGKD